MEKCGVESGCSNLAYPLLVMNLLPMGECTRLFDQNVLVFPLFRLLYVTVIKSFFETLYKYVCIRRRKHGQRMSISGI